MDVRVIAATNVDLQEEVAKGQFREGTTGIDPLRDRCPQSVDIVLATDNTLPYDKDTPAKVGKFRVFSLVPSFVSGYLGLQELSM